MYTRQLSEDERSVLNRLVELCCEAYWQEAKCCRICYQEDKLIFAAHINSSWSAIEKEELSLEDYALIVHTLRGIFDPIEPGTQPAISNRIVTVTLDENSERPIMNLWLDFNGEKANPANQVVELTIEDLVANDDDDDEPLDSEFIN